MKFSSEGLGDNSTKFAPAKLFHYTSSLRCPEGIYIITIISSFTFLIILSYVNVNRSGHKSALAISVSSLPHQISEEDVISYFECQGDEVEVCSVQIHDDGRATIKLVGLTKEGILVLC